MILLLQLAYKGSDPIATYRNFDADNVDTKAKIYVFPGGHVTATDVGVVVTGLVEQFGFNDYNVFTYINDVNPTSTVALYDDKVEPVTDNAGDIARYIDAEGTEGTVYKIGVEVTSCDENGFSFATGFYNEDNDFALYRTYDVEVPGGADSSEAESADDSTSEGDSADASQNTSDDGDSGDNGSDGE